MDNRGVGFNAHWKSDILVLGQHLGLDDIPKAGRVVLLQQVRQFMNDDVIDHKHRRLDELPVEIQVVVRRA